MESISAVTETEKELKNALKNKYQSISIKGALAKKIEQEQESFIMPPFGTPVFMSSPIIFFLKKMSSYTILKLMDNLFNNYVVEKDTNGGFKCERKK